MPPRSRPPRHPRPGARATKLGFIDRDAISALLAPFVPDTGERAFVVRCLVDEGPAHHRGANYVLLRLLGRLLHAPATRSGDVCAVPMQLPPHLADELDDEAEQTYPLDLPLAPLDLLAPRGSQEQEAMVAALIDGPPQHALANVAMVAILDALLRQTQERPS
jgi:hypothetical protein